VRRTLAAAVAIAFLALYWLPCRTETDATPANHAHRLPTSPPPRTSGWPVAQQPIEAAAIADRRDERVSAPAAAAIAHPTSITLLLRGAPADQLHGTAMVRRKDGSTTATGFHDGRCEVHERSALDGVSLHVAGFAVAWPRLSGEAVTIEVPMRRAGAIRVRLIDTAGQPLAHRTITAMCQGAARATPHSVGYSASVGASPAATDWRFLSRCCPGRMTCLLRGSRSGPRSRGPNSLSRKAKWPHANWSRRCRRRTVLAASAWRAPTRRCCQASPMTCTAMCSPAARGTSTC